MRRLAVTGILCGGASAFAGSGDGAANANALVFGRWVKAKANGCIEHYEFRPQDKFVYTSDAGAHVEGDYVLSAQPGASGLHKLLIKVTKTNAGKDCDGDVRKVQLGGIVTAYMLPDPAKGTLQGCTSDRRDSCEEPMRRSP